MKKINFKHSNFTKNNTPKNIQKIGNIGLKIGAVGAVIIATSATLPISLPSIILTAATWAVSIGTITKAVSKCFGELPIVDK